MEDTWSFKKEFGYEPPRPIGERVCIMRYTKSYGGTIAAPKEVEAREKYESIVGRVVRLGSGCFKGKFFENCDKEDFYKVGDYVTFRVNPGTWFKYGKEDIRIKQESPLIVSPSLEPYEVTSLREFNINNKTIKRPILTIIFDEHINGIVEDPDYIERE